MDRPDAAGFSCMFIVNMSLEDDLEEKYGLIIEWLDLINIGRFLRTGDDLYLVLESFSAE